MFKNAIKLIKKKKTKPSNRNFLVVQCLRILCQCMGRGFDSCSRKIPRATEQLSLCATTVEPVFCNKRSHSNENLLHINWRVAPAHHN